MLLGVRRDESRGLGTCQFHVGDWPVMVHSLGLLAILKVLTYSKASGPFVYCGGL